MKKLEKEKQQNSDFLRELNELRDMCLSMNKQKATHNETDESPDALERGWTISGDCKAWFDNGYLDICVHAAENIWLH